MRYHINKEWILLMNGETKCSYCGCFCQGFKGPDGKIYCANCYNKKWGKYPWE